MTQAGLCLRNLALSNDIPSPRWKNTREENIFIRIKILKGRLYDYIYKKSEIKISSRVRWLRLGLFTF